MTEPPFREEALAHHRGRVGPGRMLRAAPSWTRAAFWLLALAAAAGVTAGLVVKVDRVVFLPVSVDGARVSATIPPALGDRAARCDTPARLIVPGREAIQVRSMTIALDRLGAVAERPVPETAGTLRLCVGRRALLADLVPGLGS